MDPLSLTASILTVVGAAGAVGKGFSKLIALRYAPGILLALNNEVADLYCVVQAVDHLLREHTETIHIAAITNLCRSLERAQTTLFELEDLIRDGLTIVRSNGGERKLDRVGWLRSASKVRELKNQLRADRTDLSAALSLLASSASLAVDIQLRQLTFSIQTLGDQVDRTGGALMSQVQGLFGLHGKHSDSALEENDAVCETEEAVAEQSLASTSHAGSSPPSFNSLTKTSPVTARNIRPRRILREAHSYPTSLKVTKNTCALNCGCACHRRNRLKSPNVLNTLLGTLFVGYQASPWFSRGCDDAICQSRSAKITYAFPQWFLRRTISFTMGIGHPGGLEFSARMMRVRPDDADIFMAVFRGGCNHVERLLGNGAGSVLDVDTQFNTALHWALRKMHFQTIELLVLEGSDAFFENSSGAFPYFMAWEKILGESDDWNEDELNLLKDLFSDQSHLDSFHFSELHKAYLGISGKLFEDVLAYTKRSTIDEVDVSGRTTLSWAAQRGDSKAVKQLLERGASANKPDVADKTPLHWSERANDSECMRLLLLNDANVEAKDSRGRTVLSYVASKKEDPSFLEILVRFNADIESEDDERWKPLHWAAHKDCPVTLSQLLDKGANTDATDKRNRSALHLAILRNCHKNIRILIERQACGKPGKSELGYTILHTAARYGDIETLALLESAALGHINIDERNKDGFTAMADAEWRRDENEQWADVSLQPRDEDTLKWYIAFETLVKSIRKDQQKLFEGDDDDVRGELFDDESSGWIKISAKDHHEIWEDTLGSADGSSDVNTPDQGRNGVAAPWPTQLSSIPSQRRSSI